MLDWVKRVFQEPDLCFLSGALALYTQGKIYYPFVASIGQSEEASLLSIACKLRGKRIFQQLSSKFHTQSSFLTLKEIFRKTRRFLSNLFLQPEKKHNTVSTFQGTDGFFQPLRNLEFALKASLRHFWQSPIMAKPSIHVWALDNVVFLSQMTNPHLLDPQYNSQSLGLPTFKPHLVNQLINYLKPYTNGGI